MRVLHVEPARYDESTRGVLERDCAVTWAACADQSAFVEAVRRAPYDALFVRLGLAVDRDVLDAAPTLKWVVTPTTGLDHIDVAEAERRGVRVISLRGETELLERVHSTAELTWGLLLAVVRRVPAAHAEVLQGRWPREPFVGEELHGKTLGILGLGRLGRKVAGYGIAFGMDVIACDIDAASFARGPAGVARRELDEVVAAADVLSLHLPLDATTSGILDAARIGQMKPGSFLVNTARGELVDEGALLAALRDGRLAGAGLDVLAGDARWDDAGPPCEHPLIEYARAHPNLVLTPHIGGYGRGSIETTRRFVTERFLRAIRTEGSTP